MEVATRPILAGALFLRGVYPIRMCFTDLRVGSRLVRNYAPRDGGRRAMCREERIRGRYTAYGWTVRRFRARRFRLTWSSMANRPQCYETRLRIQCLAAVATS